MKKPHEPRFYSVLTTTGAQKLAQASANHRKVMFQQLAVGDGHGVAYQPDATQTSLVHETYRADIESVYTDQVHPNCIVCEHRIPTGSGGWTIREVGLFDEDGDLIAVGNFPATYKPTLAESAHRVQVIRMVVQVSSTDCVEIRIDNSVAFATLDTVDRVAADLDNLRAQHQALRQHMQFLPYDPKRIYQVGDVCSRQDNRGHYSFWQWYSNVEALSGQDPSLSIHRHVDWSDETRPFYWIPYTGNQTGMPFFWLSTTAPEWAVMEKNLDLPTAVYWRLAQCYPHLVRNQSINTGEIRGEFLRVLDQGRGIDKERRINTAQADELGSHAHTIYGGVDDTTHDSGQYYTARDYQGIKQETSYVGGDETRPRNVARAMAISI